MFNECLDIRWTHWLRFPKISELHIINNYIIILGFCWYISLTIKY